MKPASTGSVTPVTYRASSETSQRIALEMSTGSHNDRRGYLTWVGHAARRHRFRGMAGSAPPCDAFSRRGLG